MPCGAPLLELTTNSREVTMQSRLNRNFCLESDLNLRFVASLGAFLVIQATKEPASMRHISTLPRLLLGAAMGCMTMIPSANAADPAPSSGADSSIAYFKL